MKRVKLNAMVNLVGFAAFLVLAVTGLVELIFLPTEPEFQTREVRDFPGASMAIIIPS